MDITLDTILQEENHPRFPTKIQILNIEELLEIFQIISEINYWDLNFISLPKT